MRRRDLGRKKFYFYSWLFITSIRLYIAEQKFARSLLNAPEVSSANSAAYFMHATAPFSGAHESVNGNLGFGP